MTNNASTPNYYKQLKDSVTFNMSLSSKELFHSNFLAWLADVDTRLFIEVLKQLDANVDDLSDANYYPNCEEKIKEPHDQQSETTIDSSTNYWIVRREYKNFDICVIDQLNPYDKGGNPVDLIDGDDIGGRIRVVIENKVKSIPYPAQLKEYDDKINKYNKNQTDVSRILLSLAKPINWAKWAYKSYQDYCQALGKALGSDKQQSKIKDIIEDYLGYISALSSVAQNWLWDKDRSTFIYFGDENYSSCKKLRIHDVYHKLRMANFGQRIYDALPKKELGNCIITLNCNDTNLLFDNDEEKKIKAVNDCIIYPSNDGQNGGADIDIKERSIIQINFGIMHSAPLLDLKFRPRGKDFMYCVEIQDDWYMHAVIWKDINDCNEAWRKISNDSDHFEDWLLVNNNKPNKNENWVWCQKDLNLVYPICSYKCLDIDCKGIFENDTVFPEKPSNRGGFPYYKFKLPNVFVYQKRQLHPDVTIDAVVNYVVNDIMRIVKKWNNSASQVSNP